ncbi:MAG: hypothetical protein R2712_23915 [Vicinamibacterales bacterium]
MIHSAVIDPRRLATNLALGDDGLWWPVTRSRVDYPDAGNAFCFQVEDHFFWFAHRNRCIAAIVGAHPPEGPILDIGGGNGFVTRGLWPPVTPPSSWNRDQAGARSPARGLSPVICSTLEDAGFLDGAPPAAGLFDVVEHTRTTPACSSACSDYSPGGRLYITVPAFQSLWSNEDAIAGHHRRYRLAALRRLVEDAASRWTGRRTSSRRCRCPSCWCANRAPRSYRPAPDVRTPCAASSRRPSGPLVAALRATLAAEARWIERGRTLAGGGRQLPHVYARLNRILNSHPEF